MFLMAEGFEGWQGSDATTVLNGNMVDSSSTGINGAAITTSTRFGVGRAINGNGGGTFDLRVAVANRTKVFQGVAHMWFQTSTALFEVYDGSTLQCWLQVDGANRRINVYRGSGTTNLIAQSTAGILPTNSVWFYIEWCPVIHPSAGTIEVRLNGGQTIINASGLNTRASGTSQITSAALRNTGIGSTLDDYYCFDDQGSINNNFNGDSRVYTLFPASDNGAQSFTRSAGSVNAANVDDLADIDDDSTYNSSSTVGHKDSFNIDQLPTGVTPQAMEVRIAARKDDVTARSVRSYVERASTTANGTTRTLATTYTLWVDRYELDPTDSSTLSRTNINATHLGYEVVS